METLEIRIGGYKSQLATNHSKTDELGKELYRRKAEAAKAAREKEFADLKEHGAARATKIQNLLRQLELFVRHPRGLEAQHNPEVHLAKLEQGGWGYATPFQHSPGEPVQYPLQLTLCNMQPKQ
jgi:hypothetical protein